MKKTFGISTAVITLLGALLPVHLAAQAVRAGESKHHHYRLIDIGTFGGPQSHVNPGSGNETGNYTVVLNMEDPLRAGRNLPHQTHFFLRSVLLTTALLRTLSCGRTAPSTPSPDTSRCMARC
jgi:hypothetical protein